MPLYDYQCNNCEYIFEVFHGLEERGSYCPNCTCPQITRLISSVVALRCSSNNVPARVETAIKQCLGRGATRDALRLAEKAIQLTGTHKGMDKIKITRDKLRNNLDKK